MRDTDLIEQYQLKANLPCWLVGDTHRQCTNCFSIFEKTSKTVALCGICNSGRVKTQNTEIRMYRRAKARASKRKVEFDITPEDIMIPSECPILGIPLYCTTGKSGAF